MKTYQAFITTLLILFFMIGTASLYAQPNGSESLTYPSYNVRGFVQQQFIDDQTPGVPAGFSIYRARIGIAGNITDQLSINLIGGFVEPPQRTPRLVNAFVDYRLSDFLTIRAGQFLLPFGLEGPEVITFNPAIERSMAIRRLNTFNMFRDVGVQLRGNWSRLNYAAAIINGTGANQAAQLNPKDMIGRIGLKLSDNLEIGISGHTGKYHLAGNPDSEESRNRFGLDIHYTGNPFFFRGEFITRKDELPDNEHITMNGGYLLAGFYLTDQIESIIRYDYFKPNTDLDDNLLIGYTIGANYYITGRNRLSINYEIRDNDLNPEFGNLLTLQLQVVL